MQFVTPQNPTPAAESGAFNPAILAELAARGLIAQTTPGLEAHLAQPRTLYCGFDPTADSLHIGSLVPLLTLRRFQQAGHTPIVLVGGATGLIGDPSFKAQERKLNTAATVQDWVEKLKAQTSRFVSFAGANAARMANNYDWTQGLDVLTFLRDVGKNFSVNTLIAKEAIKSRLTRDDAGISFTEFTYPLLQAFDFLCLFRQADCSVQIGGSDQWGNMTAGTELIRKTVHGEGHVLTLPLVTKADGTKFGKTESGTVWLDAQKTSPYAFYQFWLNTADADVATFLKYFSLRPVAEIQDLITKHDSSPEARLGQKALAIELTTVVHGGEALIAAQRITSALFGGAFETLNKADYAQLAMDGLPAFFTKIVITEGIYELEAKTSPTALKYWRESTEQSVNLTHALTRAELASSNREARDFIKSGAVQHNGVPVTDETLLLTPANALFGRYHLLRRGKKNYALLIHA